MSELTKIWRNESAAAMRAMALTAMPHLKWRHHGIGVLQAYLSEDSEPEVRMHVWSRLLLKPGMEISGDAHDHRFHMVSHVLIGSIAHEELIPVADQDGDHGMLALTHARAAADNKFHGPIRELDGRYRVHRNLMRIAAGQSYSFQPGQFHRSRLLGSAGDVVVTVVDKHAQQDLPARILYPLAQPPVMAFGHDMDEALVDTVLARARSALLGVRHG